MQRVTKKTKVKDDLTPEEVTDVKEFYKAKAEGKTKVSTLKELFKELDS
ncbi:MAG: hypothetical protein PXX83_00610 [Candidatus Nitrosotalea sp.]|nr:hypothetical protein [Candidatus Nitrosotalea sp.]